MKKTLFLSFLALSLPLHAGEVDMKPTHISLFDNGYGYISLQAKLDTGTSIRLNSLPVPTLGSFWIGAQPGVEIQRLVSGELDYEVNVRVDLFSLAAANPNKKAIVYFQRGKDEAPIAAEGIILPFPTSRELRTGNTIDQISEEGNNPLIGSVLMLKQPDRTLALTSSQILDIAFLEDIELPTQTERRPGVELELKNDATGKLIEASCISSGITWLPSYRITLHEDGTAQLNAKATITNRLMNMDDITLDLVLGSPNLSNLYSTDPMAMRDIGVHRAKSRSTVAMAPPAMHSLMYEAEGSDDSFGMAGGSAPDAAIGTGNLYFYPINNFSAKAGQVITQPLFQSKLDYKNVYTWKLGDPRHMQSQSKNDLPQIGEISREVHFKNPLEIPLMSAPVEFIEADRIAATNNLSFTPPKTDTKVYLSEAMNITTLKKLQITATTDQVVPYNDKRDKKVTSRTSEVALTANNQMDKPVELRITQSVLGEITAISDSPQIDKIPTGGNADNPVNNSVNWTVTIPANSSKTVNYTYIYKTSTLLPEKTDKK